jgi:hypothetical protein
MLLAIQVKPAVSQLSGFNFLVTPRKIPRSYARVADEHVEAHGATLLNLLRQEQRLTPSAHLPNAAWGPERHLLRDSNTSEIGGKAELLSACSKRR